MAGFISRAGLVNYPTGVTAASWDARSVWLLYRNDRTGPQGVTSYKIPGVDSLPAGASLLSATITVSSSCSLDGWDMRSKAVNIRSSDVTLKNSLLNSSSGIFTPVDVGQGGGTYANVIIEQNDFDGEELQNSTACGVNIRAGHSAIVRKNRFRRMQSDSINCAGTNCLMYANYFLGGGFAVGAHADQLVITKGSGNRAYGNLHDVQKFNASAGVNNAIRIDAFSTNAIDDVDIYNNIVLGSNPDLFYPLSVGKEVTASLSNVSIRDGLWEKGSTGEWHYPSADGVTVSSGNKELSTGNALTELI